MWRRRSRNKHLAAHRPSTTQNAKHQHHHEHLHPSSAEPLRCTAFAEQPPGAHEVRTQQRCNQRQETKTVNARRRAKRKATERSRRDSVLAARRNRFDSQVFRELEDGISILQEVMAQRKQDLDAARDKMGGTIKNADPCTHYGAKLFAK